MTAAKGHTAEEVEEIWVSVEITFKHKNSDETYTEELYYCSLNPLNLYRKIENSGYINDDDKEDVYYKEYTIKEYFEETHGIHNYAPDWFYEICTGDTHPILALTCCYVFYDIVRDNPDTIHSSTGLCLCDPLYKNGVYIDRSLSPFV